MQFAFVGFFCRCVCVVHIAHVCWLGWLKCIVYCMIFHVYQWLVLFFLTFAICWLLRSIDRLIAVICYALNVVTCSKLFWSITCHVQHTKTHLTDKWNDINQLKQNAHNKSRKTKEHFFSRLNRNWRMEFFLFTTHSFSQMKRIFAFDACCVCVFICILLHAMCIELSSNLNLKSNCQYKIRCQSQFLFIYFFFAGDE